MKRIRFIINPISGSGKNRKLEPLLKEHIDKRMFESEICFTETGGHAIELAKEAVTLGYDIVAAVGGDGSVNEVARSLVHTPTALAIIPTGSGNGMARHLGISMNCVKAIRIINNGLVQEIDTITVNEHFCIGTIGVSFDAHIAHLFSKAPKRGYSTYIKLVLTEFARFPAKKFSILVDGKIYEEDCFLLTFSNSSQFGNNFVIAPFASVRDGFLDISTMKKFPAYIAPAMIYRMITNSLKDSKYYHGFQGKKVVVKNNAVLEGHIDGEPVIFNNDLEIKIIPLSLKVIVPQSK